MNKVSILMLTYNAPKYVYKSIKTVKEKTADVDYELIVFDNASKPITKFLLKHLNKKGYIDKLFLNDKNDLFAKGNNKASALADKKSSYYLLLNSDIEIKNEKWLSNLLSMHPANGGISSYGAVLYEPVRADGYCMLIDKSLYDKYRLNENFEWWWSVTELESHVLKENKDIIAVANHEKYIHHFGGKSGKGFKDAKGMDINIEEVKKWFNDKKVTIIDKAD